MAGTTSNNEKFVWAFGDLKAFMSDKDKPSSMTKDEEEYLKVLKSRVSSNKDGRVTLMPNYQGKRGFSIDLSSNELVRNVLPIVSAERWFGVIAVARVPAEAIKQSSVLTAGSRALLQEQISKIIDQFTREEVLADWSAPTAATDLSALLRLSGDQQENRFATDPIEWSAGIGSHGHFIGIYEEKTSKKATADDQDESSDDEGEAAARTTADAVENYYLVFHGDAGPLSKPFHEYLKSDAVADRTLDWLVNSSSVYQRAKEFSKRNAARALALLAESLGVSDALRAEPDKIALVNSVRPNEDAQDVLPRDRVSFTMYNLLQRHPLNRENVTYYSHSTPLSDLDKTERQEVAFLKRPQDGLSLYTLDPKKDYTSERVFTGMLESGQVRQYREKNPSGAAPIGLRKLLAKYERSKTADPKTLTQWKKLSTKIYWKRRADSGNWRLASYEKETKQSTQGVSVIYGQNNSNVRTLRPVAVMIPAHEC